MVVVVARTMLQPSVGSGKAISILLGWHVIDVVVNGVWVGVSDRCVCR